VQAAREIFNRKIMPALAMESADESFTQTLRQSTLFRFSDGIWQRLKAAVPKLSALGSLCQQLSFLAMLLLFAILAAPQFANDKEGLATIVVAAVGLRILGTLFGGRESFTTSAVDGLVCLYFATNVIASSGSHYVKESFFGLAKLVVYVLSYFLFIGCFQRHTKARLIQTLVCLVGGAFVVSLYGLYQYKIGVAPLATWEDPTIEDKATRVFSTLGNPNLLAGYLVPIVPLAVSLAGVSVFARGWFKWLCLPLSGVAVVIAVTTFLTGSRGGYIGLFVELGIMFLIACTWLWRERPASRIILFISAVIIPAAAALLLHFALPSFEHRFLSIFAGSEHSSNAYRMNVWRSSLAMFKDNWWIGVGTGNKAFRLAYGLYMRSSFDALGTYCVPLEVAVETGVLGLVAFFWMLLVVLSRAHNNFWTSTDPVLRWITIGAAASLIGMMAHGLVDTVFLRPQVQFIFWLLIAMLVVPATADKDPET
jgi:putative inorganic carbon (HCO3(-)) transporter